MKTLGWCQQVCRAKEKKENLSLEKIIDFSFFSQSVNIPVLIFFF